jgi:hypothetical protein
LHITTEPRGRNQRGHQLRLPQRGHPTQPRRRLQEGKRRCSTAAARSDQADLGFPLASSGGKVRPMNTPPRRKWHPQASPWSASEAPSKAFTRARDLSPSKTETSGEVAGKDYHRRKQLSHQRRRRLPNHRSSTLARQT